jgi:alkylation response protein AidB-like acyl-CoA dehydrogenase
METVEDFRARAAAWIPDHLPKVGARGDDNPVTRKLVEQGEDPEHPTLRSKALQRIIYDGGFAGVAYPKEYGGQGLTARHMQAFNAECRGYDLAGLGVYGMTFGMIGPTILEFGTEEQKEQHIRGFLTGENIWIQFLSEPTGGSDLASVLTRADRDGDEWVINGSKIWTSLGEVGDYGMLVARTNWDVPKHSGISVFLCPVHTDGLEVQPLRLVTGATGFCQEFFTDVRITDADRIGDVDDGWTVGIRWLYHERSFALSPHLVRPPGGGELGVGADSSLIGLARASGRLDDPIARDMIGEVRADSIVAREAVQRIAQAMRTGYLNDQGAALSRLLSGVNGTRHTTVAFELAGEGAIAWEPEDAAIGRAGVAFLSRQAGEIGGGTTEMARNVISERVLGMPRERAGDRDGAYRDVPKGPTTH